MIEYCDHPHITVVGFKHWANDVDCDNLVWARCQCVMVIPARRGLTVFRRVHPEHALTHLATSLDMPGHQ